MSAPWMKFYPRDWRGDQALRAVSLAARGLWMEMLCIMHEASPYGYLLLGGRDVSNDVLARMAGAGADEVSALLIELESAGVLGRSRKGVIFSRRMVKDKSRADKGRKAVNKRWSQDTEKEQESDTPNRSANSLPTTQKPEARDSVPNGTGQEPDPVKQIFDLGVALLEGTGTPAKQARSLLGKWRKAQGDGMVLMDIMEAKARNISQPVEWIEARHRSRPVGNNALYAEAAKYRRTA
jgi:hypothetical protein